MRFELVEKIKIITNRVSIVSFFLAPFLIVFLSNWYGPLSNVPYYILLLFPMMIYETKYNLIYLPLLKMDRGQNLLVVVNLFIFCILVGSTFLGVFCKSINVVLFFISIGHGLRTLFFELKYLESSDIVLKFKACFSFVLPWAFLLFLKYLDRYFEYL